jgi:hypothetical protein
MSWLRRLFGRTERGAAAVEQTRQAREMMASQINYGLVLHMLGGCLTWIPARSLRAHSAANLSATPSFRFSQVLAFDRSQPPQIVLVLRSCPGFGWILTCEVGPR